MMNVTFNKLEATVHCQCGAKVDVVLDRETLNVESLELLTADGDADLEAVEHHGWGEGCFCPDCETKYQRECADERRAEMEREDAA